MRKKFGEKLSIFLNRMGIGAGGDAEYENVNMAAGEEGEEANSNKEDRRGRLSDGGRWCLDCICHKTFAENAKNKILQVCYLGEPN